MIQSVCGAFVRPRVKPFLHACPFFYEDVLNTRVDDCNMQYEYGIGGLRSKSLMKLLFGLKEHPCVPEGMAWQDTWDNLQVISFCKGKGTKGHFCEYYVPRLTQHASD